jgi:hypothetical protein
VPVTDEWPGLFELERDDVAIGRKSKPSHYKVLCISMYTRDIADVDAKVAELKRRGWAKANRSSLIRLALSQFDVESVAGLGERRRTVDCKEALAADDTNALR